MLKFDLILPGLDMIIISVNLLLLFGVRLYCEKESIFKNNIEWNMTRYHLVIQYNHR